MQLVLRSSLSDVIQLLRRLSSTRTLTRPCISACCVVRNTFECVGGRFGCMRRVVVRFHRRIAKPTFIQIFQRNALFILTQPSSFYNSLHSHPTFIPVHPLVAGGHVVYNSRHVHPTTSSRLCSSSPSPSSFIIASAFENDILVLGSSQGRVLLIAGCAHAGVLRRCRLTSWVRSLKSVIVTARPSLSFLHTLLARSTNDHPSALPFVFCPSTTLSSALPDHHLQCVHGCLSDPATTPKGGSHRDGTPAVPHRFFDEQSNSDCQ